MITELANGLDTGCEKSDKEKKMSFRFYTWAIKWINVAAHWDG